MIRTAGFDVGHSWEAEMGGGGACSPAQIKVLIKVDDSPSVMIMMEEMMPFYEVKKRKIAILIVRGGQKYE